VVPVTGNHFSMFRDPQHLKGPGHPIRGFSRRGGLHSGPISDPNSVLID
jgi:hypothetical protein